TILMGNSVIKVDNEDQVKGKKVLVIEDGPTVTHGGMPLGAGLVAAKMLGASEIVDPRPYATGSIAAAYKKYPHMTQILPALGYGDTQVKELEKTINAIPCDLVVIGTPIDLRNVLTLNKPAVRARYELQEPGTPNLMQILDKHYPGKK
ncbi:MAG TPA: hypothetical protein VLV18_05485, partial [Terriglobales bacterium]|nr:hypothetical protein [Terriglobales bacterium]